ncbi:hypothetical protein [Alteromonas antoniana]|uniref:hypothetical protein n=1 Tax=Alteromonas antoniana TaxID=2803813 RepID=UPI001C472DEC|nr:hypothetical protein [Alteromonas antoniana]
MEHDVNVTHVCQECESIHNQTVRNKALLPLLLSSVAFLIFALLLLYVSAFVGGAGVLLAVFYFWSRNKKCPECGRYGLIPVATPKGMKIMKKNGWSPNK